MTLRKITVDNSVKSIAQNEQPRFKPNMGKDRKRDKENSENDKKNDLRCHKRRRI